ncbi:hypothetical protein MKW98_030547 [Papaver atlanticum]|uniref:Uncharacterized protein n=1 Tax=Papaver atlanticum TaxID=357466 RepID=A0AAD4T4M4_9MAGN|nr:hypothetical protein MKW98_030547 [Papaver atlanticum]
MLTRKGLTGAYQGKKLDATLSKLKEISDLLQKAEQQAYKKKYPMKTEQQLVLVKRERIVHKECERSRRQLYNQRSEIIKSIPCFWLIAFSSDYALHHLLSREDRKIFRFLNSVNVEESEDEEGVISGYTITLKFDENPYFENEILEKTISYTVMSINEYTDAKVKIGVSDIHWKEGMVSELIKKDLWPDAGRYFGNLDDGNKVDLYAIDKTARYTSPLPTVFI